MLKPGKSLKVLTCRSPVGWPMLFVAGQMRMPVLEGCSSDGERGGAPSNMPTPGTHCPGCLCSPGQRQTEVRHSVTQNMTLIYSHQAFSIHLSTALPILWTAVSFL